MDNTCLYPQTELFSSEKTGGIVHIAIKSADYKS